MFAPIPRPKWYENFPWPNATRAAQKKTNTQRKRGREKEGRGKEKRKKSKKKLK